MNANYNVKVQTLDIKAKRDSLDCQNVQIHANFLPHLKAFSLVFKSSATPRIYTAIQPFARNAIFLFRTRSVNEILCHL